MIFTSCERGENFLFFFSNCIAKSDKVWYYELTSRFTFEGFLPAVKGERKKQLAALVHEARTMILYEAPHKLKATLSDMSAAFGEDRKIALCREITKINEEVIRTTLKGAIALFNEKEPRGEFVLILDGASFDFTEEENQELISLTPNEHVEYYVNQGMKKMDAIKAAAKDRKIPKSEMYKITLE